MSAAPAAPSTKIVFVVANVAKHDIFGKIGFWLSELAHAYHEFQKLGWHCEIASPDGGKVEFDAFSDPEGPKYAFLDLISAGFKHHPKTSALLENTTPLSKITVGDYDGIYVVGGLSPMVTFANNEALHKLFAQFYEAGKAAITICHGSAILLKTKLSNGKLLAEGKKWTGYSNGEEDILNKMVGKTVQPWRIEDEAKKLPTTYQSGAPFKPFAVRDGNLISGQNGASGGPTAHHVIEFLKSKSS